MLFFARSFRLFLLLFLHHGSKASIVGGSLVADKSADRLSLLDFKLMVADPSETLRSWNDSLHFCRWEGIACDPRHGRVTRLDLPSKGLVGRLSPSLGNISFLEVLFIPNNNFSGRIPEELGLLSRLKSLIFTNNSFNGEIPKNLSYCTELENLDLGGNKLIGNVPIDIFSLSSLKLLGYSRNNITGVDMNYFTGSIPLSLSNISSLKTVTLGSNNFSGKLRVDFGGMKNLSALVLDDNNLGSGDMDELSFLSSMANCSKLSELSFSHNSFEGALPSSLANLSTQLQRLLLGRNRLYGEIPSGIGNLVELNTLGFEGNNFSGNLPADIGKLLNLGWLTLGGNALSGQIPAAIGNLTRLITLGLEKNRFHGAIPESIRNCQELSFFSVVGNLLNGSIPKQIFSLSKLGVGLDLSQNKFSGDLPIEVGCLLTALVLSGNELFGNIPSELGNCESLEYLDLEGNYFDGSIPSSFSSLRDLRFLDLAGNNLSGQIPDFLSTFYMSYLNLSFNNFEGEVPSNGVFSNASAISLLGNDKLCGGIIALCLPNCTHSASKRPKSTKLLKIIISICMSLLGLAIIFFFLFCLVLKKKKRKVETSSLLMKDSLFLEISYDDLRKATDDFSSNNLIGNGYFSSVYKGYLEKVGETVAIKVLNLQNHGATRSFTSECEALRNIRHRNLLKTITSCSSIDFHGNDFKAIVYEFMINGSLDSWLHVGSDGRGERLKLLQRLNIAIEVASGLDYLHHHCHIPIVHCDLKPSNILLDEEMTANIGDFGLAKLLPKITNYTNSSSMGIRGTIGYSAPEYGQGSAVSTVGDIYSYGILLLEMVTGRRPTDEMFTDGLDLDVHAERALCSQVTDIVDPVLLPLRVEEKIKTINALASMVKLGVACSALSPRDRMDLEDVQGELIMVKKALLASDRTT